MSTLTTSPQGQTVIKAFEGSSLHAYRDSVGVWTIGYGLTNMDAGIPWKVQAGLTITQAEAEYWLPKSLQDNYEPACRAALKDPTQAQFDAASSFHYNTGAIKRASWPPALNRKDMGAVRSGLLAWDHAGGKVLAGLTRRRKRELAMVETGDYGPEGHMKPVVITHSEDGKADPKVVVVAPSGPTPGPGVPTTPTGPGMIGLHDTGPEVLEVQNNLVALGLLKEKDRGVPGGLGFQPGTFDAMTEDAVKTFQGSHKQLNKDGVVGPATRNALIRDIAAQKKTKQAGQVIAGAAVSGGIAWKAVGAKLAMVLGASAGVVVLGLVVYLAFRYRDEIGARVNRLIGRETPDHPADIRALEEELRTMVLKVEALNAAVARNTAAVAALVAGHSDPAGQVAVDAAVVAIDANSAAAEAAVAAPVTPAV